MTESGADENLPNALEAGADGYFLKGIEASKLIETVKFTMKGVTTADKELLIL